MIKKVKYDTIIIGSGAGGLAAAICLAREGQKVLVLEQHTVSGGWCHSFRLHGSRFTPGVHYIGLLNDGESSSELYKGLEIADDLVFFQMNKQAYEHCYIGEERFDIAADLSTFTEALIQRFPDEEKGIRNYIRTIHKVSSELQLIPKMHSFWDKATIPWRTRHLGKYGLFSLGNIVNRFIKDPLLQQILCIQCGDHGLPPRKANFALHSAVMEHYFSGGYYPMGGGSAIVKAMTKAINKHGGEIKTGQTVTKILLQDSRQKKRAFGVELQDGTQLYADTVLSNADPSKTYLDLVGKENLSQKLSTKLEKTRYSCTSLMLFLTVDMDVRAAGLDSGNIWVMPQEDMDVLFDKMMEPDIISDSQFSGLFISCTTLKDPTSFDGKHHVLEVITFIDYDAFKRFEGKKDTEEYLVFKEVLTQKMICSLENVIPNIKEHIIHKELGTPLTNEHYINTTRGNIYGTEKSLKHIGPFSFQHTSEIENLYLCGASILSHGVAGSAYSGVQAAAKILNSTQEKLLQHNNTQTIQIYDAEDNAHYPTWLQQSLSKKISSKSM